MSRSPRRVLAIVIASTLVGISLVTATTVTLLYRHYDANLNVQDVTKELGKDRPKPARVKGPQGPINILVLGSDDRDAPGNRIDNQVGKGKRSDTTILLHLSADRRRAYGVSIPRDSIIDRPACIGQDGKPISAPVSDVMWNDAFSVGGAGCTQRQFEQLTGIRVDHYLQVDFSGFEGMVNALGGVEVCIPQPIVDTKYHINIPAGTRKLTGRTALNYVRERHDIGDASDIGREKRQQAFVASMVQQLIDAKTLANPISVTRFLDSATRSLTLDEGLGSIPKLADLGYQFRHIGLDHIQFLTTPWLSDPDGVHVDWAPEAQTLWRDLRADKVLPASLLEGAINAGHVPGVGHHRHAPSGAGDAYGLCA